LEEENYQRDFDRGRGRGNLELTVEDPKMGSDREKLNKNQPCG